MVAGVADRVGGRSTACRNHVAETPEAKAHGHFAGQRADSGGGNHIHAALLLQAGIIEPILLFGKLLTAAAGAQHDADFSQLVAIHPVWFKARIGQRFLTAAIASGVTRETCWRSLALTYC